jgi:putative NADPH-quinone reductase
LGAGFGHRAVHAGARHPWLAGKALVSITSSGTPIQWLELKGARAAHRTLFVDYIAQSFGMASADHLHVPAVTDDLDPERFERHIASVTEQALATCVQLDRRQQDCDRQDSPATG